MNAVLHWLGRSGYPMDFLQLLLRWAVPPVGRQIQYGQYYQGHFQRSEWEGRTRQEGNGHGGERRS